MKKATRTSVKPMVESRLAVRTLQKFNPIDGRYLKSIDERRRRIPFKTAKQIIADAARLLVPGWRPVSVILGPSGKGGATLSLGFGRDENGNQTEVYIHLKAKDVVPFTRYLVDVGESITVLIVAKSIDDEDGGEEIPVPSVSDARLAERLAEPPCSDMVH